MSIDSYGSAERGEVGIICWVLGGYITLEALNAWNFVFATKRAKLSNLSLLVLFNLFSNMFSMLVTYLFVMVPFNKHHGYMFIEGLGHIMMVNSYLWLLYNRMCALTLRRNRSKFWFWMVALQPIIPAVDVLIFSLEFAGEIPQGTFKVTGSVFFITVVLIELAVNAATLIELLSIYRNYKHSGMQANVHHFLMKCIVTMAAELLIDVGLVITNFLIDALVFIMLKRLVYTFKSRLLIFMCDQVKTDLLIKRVAPQTYESDNPLKEGLRTATGNSENMTQMTAGTMVSVHNHPSETHDTDPYRSPKPAQVKGMVANGNLGQGSAFPNPNQTICVVQSDSDTALGGSSNGVSVDVVTTKSDDDVFSPR